MMSPTKRLRGFLDRRREGRGGRLGAAVEDHFRVGVEAFRAIDPTSGRGESLSVEPTILVRNVADDDVAGRLVGADDFANVGTVDFWKSH